MQLWLERLDKEDWIKNVSAFNNLILIYGLLGTGKTSLVRRFVQTQNLRAKSYGFHRTLDRAAVLGGDKGQALDDILASVSITWNKTDLVIWDDVQHLKVEDRYALIQFIQSRTSATEKHIFISEENIQEEIGYGIPALLLESFSFEEIEKVLTLVPADMRLTFQPKELYLKTGGLPLLVQLSLQQKNYFSDHRIWLKQLSAAEQKIIWTAVLLTEGVDETCPIVKAEQLEIWNELVRKNIFEKRDGRYYLTNALQMLFENEISTSVAKDSAIEILEASVALSNLTQFKLSLLSQNHELKSIMSIDPDDIEMLPVQSILFYEKLVSEFMKSVDSKVVEKDKLYRIKRLYLNGLILASKRQEAVQFILLEMGVNFFESFSIEKEWFTYDAIYWLMRSGRYEDAAVNIAKFINRATSPIKEFVTIEHAIPHVQTDPDRAIEVLDRSLRQLSNIKNPKLKILCEAQARYQLAIAKTTKKSFTEAREENRLARSLYLQINKPYFAAFCLLNSTWTNYYNGSWNDFIIGTLDLKKTSEKYGYEYLGIGSDLLFTLMLFETGKDLEAYSTLEKAILKAKKIKHSQMLSHLLFTKLKFDFERTHYENAVELISELKTLGQEHSKKLKIFEKANALTLNELSEEFTDLDSVNDPFFNRMILLSGYTIKNWKARTPRDFLIEDELKLRKSKTEQDHIQFSIDLKIIANRGAQFADATEIVFAGRLARLENEFNPSDFFEIETDLQKALLPQQTHKSFSIWLMDIKNKTHTQIQERWQHWRFQDLPSASDFQIITNNNKASAVEKPQIITQGLYIDEALGEVYFNLKKIDELGNKHVLRQILTFLLESSPNSCTKASFAVRIWGEAYSPLTHDPRVYTSIQRLRNLISSNSILNQDSGYAWNRNINFLLLRPSKQDFRIEDKTQGFVFETLNKKSRTTDPWMKKSEIAEGTSVTDSTLKRALAFLVDQGKIERSGAGPSVKYRKKVS
jgi:GTPase SAR1 family protein